VSGEWCERTECSQIKRFSLWVKFFYFFPCLVSFIPLQTVEVSGQWRPMTVFCPVLHTLPWWGEGLSLRLRSPVPTWTTLQPGLLCQPSPPGPLPPFSSCQRLGCCHFRYTSFTLDLTPKDLCLGRKWRSSGLVSAFQCHLHCRQDLRLVAEEPAWAGDGPSSLGELPHSHPIVSLCVDATGK
jgi:hypothetical protein